MLGLKSRQTQITAEAYNQTSLRLVRALVIGVYFKLGLPLFLEKAENIAARKATVMTSCQTMAMEVLRELMRN